MWTCQTCGEQHEDQFDSCWKCSNSTLDADAEEVSIGAPSQEESPPAILPEKTCLRCSLSLELYGRQALDHPHGGLIEILMTPVMEAWKCPRCQRVEFYAQ